MKAIVTVKLLRNPKHDPRNKQLGCCPLCSLAERKAGIGRTCTDVTGSHHSYIESGKDRQEIFQKAYKKFGHVTRIEVIAP